MTLQSGPLFEMYQLKVGGLNATEMNDLKTITAFYPTSSEKLQYGAWSVNFRMSDCELENKFYIRLIRHFKWTNHKIMWQCQIVFRRWQHQLYDDITAGSHSGTIHLSDQELGLQNYIFRFIRWRSAIPDVRSGNYADFVLHMDAGKVNCRVN